MKSQTQHTLFALVSVTLSLGFSATGAPPIGNAFDWRNYAGTNWVTPVKNQGVCGSCWAFCAAGAVESKIMILTGNTNLQPDLSEQHIIACNGAHSGCNGGSLNDGYDFIKTNGVVNESVFPYQATNLPCQTFPGALLTKISGYYYCGTNAASVKQALVEDGPVCVFVDIYENMFSYVSGVYSNADGSFAGATSMLIVGYDDTDQCWILKNSWGTYWGEQGYVRISYAFSGLHLDYPIAVEKAYYDAFPSPKLRAELTSSTTLLIAWPAPSAGFTLQQNPDLTTTNWTSVTNIRQVVGGENQVSVSPAATRNFYRLMQP